MSFPTRGALPELCLRLQNEFQWSRQAARYVVKHSWDSRTARFFLCQDADQREPAFVVKCLPDGAGDLARRSFRSLELLAELAATADEWVATPPQALGWCSDPPAVAMENVTGRLGGRVLRDSLAADFGYETLERLLRVCGATLGRWHTSWGTDPSPSHQATYYQQLRRTAHRQGLRLPSSPDRSASLPVVRRYRDFAIYNVLLTLDERVVILDPPPEAAEHDLAYRDLAWFLTTLDRRVAGLVAERGDTTWEGLARFRAMRPVLARSFVLGYERGSGKQLLASDLRLVSVIEGSYLLSRMVRSLRRGELKRAACYLRLSRDARART